MKALLRYSILGEVLEFSPVLSDTFANELFDNSGLGEVGAMTGMYASGFRDTSMGNHTFLHLQGMSCIVGTEKVR